MVCRTGFKKQLGQGMGSMVTGPSLVEVLDATVEGQSVVKAIAILHVTGERYYTVSCDLLVNQNRNL